jgi:hypothetical protein
MRKYLHDGWRQIPVKRTDPKAALTRNVKTRLSVALQCTTPVPNVLTGRTADVTGVINVFALRVGADWRCLARQSPTPQCRRILCIPSKPPLLLTDVHNASPRGFTTLRNNICLSYCIGFKCLSSGLLRHVVCNNFTDVSEALTAGNEHSASIRLHGATT